MNVEAPEITALRTIREGMEEAHRAMQLATTTVERLQLENQRLRSGLLDIKVEIVSRGSRVLIDSGPTASVLRAILTHARKALGEMVTFSQDSADEHY